MSSRGIEGAPPDLAGGYGGLVGFELAGGRDAGRRFIDSLKLFYHVANIGDAAAQRREPVGDRRLGRLCAPVGLEHIDDILADLTRPCRPQTLPVVAE